MSRVLLGHAYYLRLDPKMWRGMQPYPPLGTLYAAAYLRAQGHDVSLFDAVLATSPSEWAGALDRDRPEVAVLFEDNFNYLSKMSLLRMREAAFEMMAAARDRGCVVVACGADATDHPDLYLDHGAHYVLVGEGEETLGELTAHLADAAETDLAAIRGLAYRDAGQTIRTPPRPALRDLDALPTPAWDLADIGAYREAWMERHGYFSLNLVTSRGCPFHCNWCAKPIWGQRYNVHSPERVADDMTLLKDRYGADHIWFMDDMMGIKPGWTARLADALDARGGHVPFKCLNRVDLLLRDGEIEALARAGCQSVWSGVESGSQTVLDAMDKGIRVEHVRAAAERLRASGVGVGFFLQFGFPGETRADIDATFALVRECRPDEIGVSVSYPLPGTPFHEMVREQLGAKQNWTDSDDLAMMYRGPFATVFYRRVARALHKEHQLGRAWDRMRPALRRPLGTRLPHLRAAAAAAYHAATLPLARLRMARAARIPHHGVAPLAPRLSPSEAATPSAP